MTPEEKLIAEQMERNKLQDIQNDLCHIVHGLLNYRKESAQRYTQLSKGVVSEAVEIFYLIKEQAKQIAKSQT